MHGRFSTINIDDYIVAYYEKVMTHAEMCKLFNCKASTLGNFRQRHGLPNREEFYPTRRSDVAKKSKNLFKKGCKPWNKGKPFPQVAGANNPNWKGGKFITVYGYAVAKAPKGHPYADKGYVKEHRLTMEAHIGRFLSPDEHVHHINHDKLDNRIENLQIVTPSEHAKIHQPKGSYFGVHAHK